MWTPLEIRIALMRKGVNLSELAVKNGFSSGACRVALLKNQSCPRVEEIISKELGIPASTLFEYKKARRGS